MVSHGLKQCSQGWSVLQETLNSVWRHFWLSRVGVGVMLVFSGWRLAEDVAEQPTIHRTAAVTTTPTKNYLAPNTNSTEAEKFCSKAG